MRKPIILVIAVALLLGLQGSAVQAQDAAVSPAQIVETLYRAVVAEDVESAAALLADDVVLVLNPPPPETNGTFVGKEAVLGWYAQLIRNNLAIEIFDAQDSGNGCTMRNFTWVDDLPIAPIEMDGTAIVQNGLVKTISWVMTPATMRNLDIAMQRLANESLVERYIEELWNQKNLDLVDEIIAEDFVSHSVPMGQGRDFMREIVVGFDDVYPGATIVIDAMESVGNRVYVYFRILGPDDDPASEAAMSSLLILDIRDGQITDRWYLVPAE